MPYMKKPKYVYLQWKTGIIRKKHYKMRIEKNIYEKIVAEKRQKEIVDNITALMPHLVTAGVVTEMAKKAKVKNEKKKR
jgi:hypothetical protein